MFRSAEIDRPPALIESQDRSGEVVTLGPDDFQRIGIQPKETRLDVIRRAASRAAKSLARRQLSAPNPLTEQQLSRIAVSTYRLLDPRQREDRNSRAHVGRIRPGALYRAGRTAFSNERILIQTCASSEASAPTHHIGESPEVVRVVVPTEIVAVDAVAEVAELPWVGPNAAALKIAAPADVSIGLMSRLRNRATHPVLILAMIMTLLVTAAAIWKWGQDVQSPPLRLPVGSTPSSSID